MLRKLTEHEVEFTIDVEEDDIPVRGNLVCTEDPVFDKQCEDEVLARLERGDDTAWCVIKVTAKYRGVEASDILGGNSFAEGSAFAEEVAQTVEHHGMKAQALEALNARIAEIACELVQG